MEQQQSDMADLYVEDWSGQVDGLFAEVMPLGYAPDGSTVATVSSVSSASCPFGCVYTWTSASSASG
jgi:hypothetical protein